MRFLSTTAIAVAAMSLTVTASEGKELRMLTWEGYADKSYAEEFTKTTGCKITAKYVGSGDEIVTTMLTGRGGDYDLFAVSADIVPRFIDAGVVEPIDMSKIPNAKGFYKQFQAPAYAMAGGQQYALPHAYGRIPIIVDASQTDIKPDSLAFLWDPSLKGKIAVWDDLEAMFMAGRYLGVKDVYDMSEDELAQVRDALIKLKPNVRKFWYSSGELINLYQQNDILASNAWESAVAEMTKTGASIRVIEPKEGLGGWIDNYMMVKGHAENECVYSWLNYVSGPDVQAKGFKATGYTFANQHMIEKLNDEDRTLLVKMGSADVEKLKNVDWWKPVKNRGRYMEVWNQVKSATAE